MPFFGKPDTSVGSIQSTFEPGLKIRCFANPNKVMQRALEPLKEGLLSVVKGLPWDCTNDQRKADQVISQSLASGKIVYSIDLSSATDRFPYWFQKLCLESVMTLNSNSDIQEQRQVASKFLLDYIVEMGYFQTSIGLKTWRVGQPLGLDPSFPLFTLSHGILLLLLNRGAWNKQFYVVGDDVVIFNRALADSYRKLLTSWGIPVSEGKTFSSNRLAQFAGVTYTPYGSFWLPKWREFTRDTLIDIAAWWYPGFTKGLRDHELIVRVLSLPEPIGIGRNPLGLPISDRLTSALAYRLAEKEADREERSKPSHTREFASYPGEDNMVHSWKQDWKLLRSNRPVLISLAFDSLMDHTEVSGYPKVQLRTRGKRDPYTLGRTQYWNQLFQELEVLSEAVPSSTDR
jgi:hypothetical protein